MAAASQVLDAPTLVQVPRSSVSKAFPRHSQARAMSLPICVIVAVNRNSNEAASTTIGALGTTTRLAHLARAHRSNLLVPATSGLRRIARFQQHQQQTQEHIQAQNQYLGAIAAIEIPEVAMTDVELKEKENFVRRLQEICQNEIGSFPDVPSIEFKCFGSIGTGFATKGSDIDLAVVTTNDEDTERAQKVGPRALEKIFLDHGFGARLLTNTRVPIIKFCEKPSDELHANLKAERKKWDDLPEEEKKVLLEGGSKAPEEDKNADAADVPEDMDATGSEDSPKDENGPDAEKKAPSRRRKNKNSVAKSSPEENGNDSTKKEQPTADGEKEAPHAHTNSQDQGTGEEKSTGVPQKREHRPEKPWLREKPMGPLDFPKDGVGIQCDLNFAGHLGIYNTRLLHCYAISDQRVRDMVIFVKAWAKTRKINSSYNGTLSSYGYALMVLHYLIRIPEEPVTLDLQLLSNLTVNGMTPEVVDVICNDHAVKFLADEEYILEKDSSDTMDALEYRIAWEASIGRAT
ncbi:pap oas1 substrate-binding domain-containing protein [Neofusicoccum parvum]|uniref:Pap oas1 substrate-binding domain-containing protein n=1 Tax=Neofusicoccum parvum TaxID=310453 RepID=A0ACB5SI38_9PEZI|nr:pap oas1 substrate-binding domain-containing protein [Neofusicoccum parvum]